MGEGDHAQAIGTWRRGWRWWISRVLLFILLINILLLMSGYIYESVAARSDWDRNPPPGERVDIGGFKLHLYCTGTRQEGMPTVILEAGGGNASPDWALVQPEIAKVTRVCSYDRAGLAWSDMGPEPRSSQVISTELHTLLTTADEPGPYILVGHSYGGHTVRIFATDYPDEVAGLVLIDIRLEELSDHPYFAPTRGGGQMKLWAVLARFGFFRLIGRAMLPAPYQEKLPDYPVNIMITPRYFEMGGIEDAVTSDNDVRATNGFGDTPLIMIVHDVSDPLMFGRLEGAELAEAERLFEQAARKIAALSTQSEYLVAGGSGHLVIIERPDLVSESILRLVEAP